MKTTMVALAALAIGAGSLKAQLNYSTRHGNTTFFPDGSYATRSGNTTFYSTGGYSTQSGNTRFYNIPAYQQPQIMPWNNYSRFKRDNW